MEKFNHLDTYFTWKNNTLTLGNQSFKRVIDWSQGLPKTCCMEADNRSIAL